MPNSDQRTICTRIFRLPGMHTDAERLSPKSAYDRVAWKTMTLFRLFFQNREIPVDAAGVAIGRSRTCQLIVSDELISREHAAFRLLDGTLWVEDLKSRNGVGVNGSRIAGRVRLHDGDIVTIGSHQKGALRARSGLSHARRRSHPARR